LPELKDEIEWRDLIRKPEKLFAFVFLYFLALILLLGMIYLGNMNTVGANAIAPAALKDSSALVQDIPLQTPLVLPPVDIRVVGVASDSLVAAGRELFRTNCAACHGDNGMGDGPTAPTLDPKPRNFHSLTGWTNGSKVSQIYRTLEEGIPRTGMASYSYMAPRDRIALAHFIRTFAQGQPVDSPEELQMLEATYQLSKGKAVPGQVPLKKALQIVLREGKPEVLQTQRLLERFSKDESPAAQALRQAAGNLERIAATSLRRGERFPPLEEFVRSVTADPAANGFRPAVERFNTQEWVTIRNYLATAVAGLHATDS
jgi:mono/diheme cytochrome c family protein